MCSKLQMMICSIEMVKYMREFFSPSLSTIGMPNDAETKCGQRFIVRHCLRYSSVAFISRKITILLLAHVQCQPIRSQRIADEI